nr:retrotransposon protein, putative, unclassified [Tanacetum cinerariifolium]
DYSVSLTAFADADHAGCQDTHRSTSDSVQFLGERHISWSSKRQKSAAISNDDGDDGNDDDDHEVGRDDDKDDDEEGGDDKQEYDDENFFKETRDEESFDHIPQTPKSSKDEGDGKEDQVLNICEEERHVEEEEEDELYRDVNINQRRVIQANLEVEDSHVTLTPVNPDG